MRMLSDLEMSLVAGGGTNTDENTEIEGITVIGGSDWGGGGSGGAGGGDGGGESDTFTIPSEGGGDSTFIDKILENTDSVIVTLSNMLNLGLTPFTRTAIDERDSKSNFNRETVTEKSTPEGQKYWVEKDGTFWMDMDNDRLPESHMKQFGDGSVWMSKNHDGNWDTLVKPAQ